MSFCLVDIYFDRLICSEGHGPKTKKKKNEMQNNWHIETFLSIKTKIKI